MKSTLKPSAILTQNPESIQLELTNRFACQKEEDCDSVDEINYSLIETVHTVRFKFSRSRQRAMFFSKPQKLSDYTLNFMAEPRALTLQTSGDAEAITGSLIDGFKY